MRFIAFLLLLTFHSVSQAFTFGATSAFSKPDFLPVDQAFQLSVSAPKDGKLIASWQIHDGYYLYQEQFGLSGIGADNLHFSPFPSGETKQDPYFGTVTVYRNTLTLPIYYDITLPVGTQVNAFLSYQGCADKGLCYAPQKVPVQFTVPALSPSLEKSFSGRSASNNTTAESSLSDSLPSDNQPSDNLFSDNSSTSRQSAGFDDAQSISDRIVSGSLLSTIALLFGLGLLLSLTPCVLPMIPIVSAIVVGTRHSRVGAFYYSVVYVLAMALTYSAIGGLVGLFGIQLNLQAHMQNPVLLIVSALVFVLLALAMFGVYELRLPSAWQQRLHTASAPAAGKWKSTLSVFLAGVLSTLVVSPCVSAPLAGTLLYISSQNEAWYGAAMLFVMAIGMGTPLLLVGLFGPKVLPKNGEWLHDIKILMGFGLLAMAVWLITRWLDSSSHLYLWSLVALACSGYFIHRACLVASHPVRWFLALVFFVLGCVEFIGGAAGNDKPLQPLKNVSSPSTTLEEAVVFDATITSLSELNALVARQDPRPIVLDLYADWCVSCKILEEMFASDDVRSRLDNVQLVRVDVTENSTENQALMQTFRLFGPPSLVFLDSNGKARDALTLMGEPSKSLLLRRLDTTLLEKP